MSFERHKARLPKPLAPLRIRGQTGRWLQVTKVAHYWLEVNAMTRPMVVREDSPPYGGNGQ
ncbi:MAG: hypothetical protein AB1640_12935 [bacterium]